LAALRGLARLNCRAALARVAVRFGLPEEPLPEEALLKEPLDQPSNSANLHKTAATLHSCLAASSESWEQSVPRARQRRLPSMALWDHSVAEHRYCYYCAAAESPA